MKRIEIKENNLNMVYEITDENEIKLLHFSNLPFDENDINYAVEDLEPELKSIIVLKYFHGYKISEVAEILDI